MAQQFTKAANTTLDNIPTTAHPVGEEPVDRWIQDVVLWGPNGQPLLVATPAGETQQILGVAGYGHDGASWRALRVRSDGRLEVAEYSSFATLRNMIGATKTATSVASEVFAGASRLAGRRCVIVKNEHPYIRIRIDGGAVTPKTGIALEPFWVAIFQLDPSVDTPIYVISEAGMVPYGVVEF